MMKMISHVMKISYRSLWISILFVGFTTASVKTFANDNCNLNLPPIDSGEDGERGVLLNIYPRKSMMPKNYSGCQTVWMLQNDGVWEKIMIGEFKNGQILRVKLPSSVEGPIQHCLFKDDKLISGDEKICEQLNTRFPMSSMPIGCLSDTVKELDCNPD